MAGTEIGGASVNTGKRRLAGRILAMAAGMALLPVPAPSGAEEAKAAAEPVRSAAVQVRLHDAPLLDQDGKVLRFASDAVGGRIVVVDTFFTNCGLICPILAAVFADLQDRLDDRLGRDVALISISVDPLTDVPPRLKKYAQQWEAKPGWLFLTGEKKVVDQVLSGLGLYAADFNDHPAAFLVGDGKTGEWTRFFGFPTPEQLMEKISALADKRKSGGRS
jgi:protein SCO1/2